MHHWRLKAPEAFVIQEVKLTKVQTAGRGIFLIRCTISIHGGPYRFPVGCHISVSVFDMSQSQIRDLQVYSAEEWDRRRRLSKKVPGRGLLHGVRKGGNTRRKPKTGSKAGTVVVSQSLLGMGLREC